MTQVLRVKGKYTATVVYTAEESGSGLPVTVSTVSEKSENMLILPICLFAITVEAAESR